MCMHQNKNTQQKCIQLFDIYFDINLYVKCLTESSMKVMQTKIIVFFFFTHNTAFKI